MGGRVCINALGCALLCALMAIFDTASGLLVVETQAGKVRGTFDRSCLGPEFCSFKGIPFAAPPVGKLKFQDPAPVESWNGIRNTTAFGSQCTQPDLLTQKIHGSDDCLYLNVYTRNCKPEKPRPVMVWIHGGAFIGGSGDDTTYGPDYFMAKDIVLVTINYRVGVLGFLNLEDEVAPGNQGLKDQVAALKWVRDNIANFGGDPDTVTIFGESAGGVSVHYLTISPMAKGLFHKAISQSGVTLNPWAKNMNPKEEVYRVCERLGFKSRDSKEIVDFLRTIDSRKLVEAQESILTEEEKMQSKLSFEPGVDAKSKEPFMPIPIEEAAEKGAQVPLIIGHNDLEGLMFATSFAGKNYEQLNHNFEKYLQPYVIDLLKRYNLSADDLKRFYFGNEKITNNNTEKLFELMGDVYFVEGVHRVAKIQAEAGSAPTYLYRYTFDDDVFYIKEKLNVTISGAPHGAELRYLFNSRRTDTNTCDLKKGTLGYRMMERLINLWVNFANTGRPTPTKTEDMPFYWTPVNSGTVLRYLNIDEDLRLDITLNLEQRYLVHKITKNKL